MKEITTNQFIDCIKGWLEIVIDSKSNMRLYESDGNICVQIEGDYVIGDLPKDKSKYAYIWEKLKENFEGEYDFASMHDMAGFYGALMFIGRIVIEFDYKSEEGQDWLYENF